MTLDKIKLGKKQRYPKKYSSSYLEKVPRELYRKAISLKEIAPFGYDYWNAYEFSCLDETGKPIIGILELSIPSQSHYIIESKSLKYYLNSFNMEKLRSLKAIQSVIGEDLSELLETRCKCHLILPQKWKNTKNKLSGICLDNQLMDPDYKKIEVISEKTVKKSYFTHHFRSLCPVTGQPDWASIEIKYEGNEPHLGSLYNYIVSFRMHEGFHEQCVEKIYSDIIGYLNPKKLIISAFFLRRGGIDICPIRSNVQVKNRPPRTFRQ